MIHVPESIFQEQNNEKQDLLFKSIVRDNALFLCADSPDGLQYTVIHCNTDAYI